MFKAQISIPSTIREVMKGRRKRRREGRKEGGREGEREREGRKEERNSLFGKIKNLVFTHTQPPHNFLLH
jgi:hypothetical protein